MTNRIKVARIALIAPTIFISLLGACAEESVSPPTAEKKPKELEIHGDVRVDDYYWLRERDNPAVIEYLEAENSYLESAAQSIV